MEAMTRRADVKLKLRVVTARWRNALRLPRPVGFLLYYPSDVLSAWQDRRRTLRRGYSDLVLDHVEDSLSAIAVDSLRRCDLESLPDDIRNRCWAIIERLSEPYPVICDTTEKLAVLEDAHRVRGHRTSPECRAIYDDFQKRRDAYDSRIAQAQHDFIDVLPRL